VWDAAARGALVREGQARVRAFEELLRGMRVRPPGRISVLLRRLEEPAARVQRRAAAVSPQRLRMLQTAWVALALIGFSAVGVALWAESRPDSSPSAVPPPLTATASHMAAPDTATEPVATQISTPRNRALPVTPPRTSAAAEAQATATTGPEPVTPSPAPTSVSAVTATPEPPPAPTLAPTPALLRHRVQPGETVFTIAQFYGVSMAAIIAANNLSAIGTISAGQELVIPRGQ
jgi:LysM repeat protein